MHTEGGAVDFTRKPEGGDDYPFFAKEMRKHVRGRKK